MAATKETFSHPVYRVVDKGDGHSPRYRTINAECVGRNGSWYKVKHQDGSIENDNGLGRWAWDVPSAWRRALMAILWRGVREYEDKHNSGMPSEAAVRAILSCQKHLPGFFGDAWQEAFEWGRLLEEVENTRPQPQETQG